MEELHKEIERLAGRKVDFKEVTLNGSAGFVPIYLNHNIRISELLAATEKEAAEKFIAFLKGIGDTDGNTETGN